MCNNMDMYNEHLYNEVACNEVLDEEYYNEVMYDHVVDTFISTLYVEIPDELPDQYQKRFLNYLETYVNTDTHKYNMNRTIFLFRALTFCDLDDATRLIKQYGQHNTVARIALQYACQNSHKDVEMYVYSRLAEPLRDYDLETILLFGEPTLNSFKMFMSKHESMYGDNDNAFWNLLRVSATRNRLDIFHYLLSLYNFTLDLTVSYTIREEPLAEYINTTTTKTVTLLTECADNANLEIVSYLLNINVYSREQLEETHTYAKSSPCIARLKVCASVNKKDKEKICEMLANAISWNRK